MSKTVSELAKEALEWFGTINDGRPKWLPMWLTDLILAAQGDMMPDDYRYKFIEDALEIIAEADDNSLDCPEIEADIYTSDLTKWLHSRNDRVYYLTEALETFVMRDGFVALQFAQIIEKEEVYWSVLESLRELCKDQEDEEEQKA